MRNAGPEEAQAGIKIAWWNINNLRYADGRGTEAASLKGTFFLFLIMPQGLQDLSFPTREWTQAMAVKVLC